VVVEVTDNTAGTTLLSCEVNSTNKNNCSNTSGSGVAGAGDNIEVKVTTSGNSAKEKHWRVTSRY
jgi:hypothetical protein